MKINVIELAKRCDIEPHDTYNMHKYETLYKEAFNSAVRQVLAIKPQDIPGGISASAGPYEVWTKLMDAIRTLEMEA